MTDVEAVQPLQVSAVESALAIDEQDDAAGWVALDREAAPIEGDEGDARANGNGITAVNSADTAGEHASEPTARPKASVTVDAKARKTLSSAKTTGATSKALGSEPKSPAVKKVCARLFSQLSGSILIYVV